MLNQMLVEIRGLMVLLNTKSKMTILKYLFEEATHSRMPLC